MPLLKQRYTYFLIRRGGTTIAGQSNPIRLINNSFAAPVVSGSWAIVRANQNDNIGEPNIASFLSIVEVPGDPEQADVHFDAAFYDTLSAPDPDTRVALRVTNNPYGEVVIWITFRIVESLDFLHVEGGTQASFALDGPPDGFPDPISGFIEDQFSWALALPGGSPLTGATLGFTTATAGQVATLDVSSSPNWNVDDAPIEVTITSGVGTPEQVSTGVFDFGLPDSGGRLSLRTPTVAPGETIAGYSFFKTQSSGGPGLNAPITGLSALASNFSGGLPAGLSLSFDESLALTALSATAPDFTETGSFDLSLSLPDRPTCTLAARALDLRRLDPDPSPYELSIDFDVLAGTQLVTFSGAGTWQWDAITPSGALAGLGATGDPNAPQFTLDWAAQALDPGASGSVDISVRRGDLSHPVSNFSLPASVALPPLGEIFVSASDVAPTDLDLYPAREKLRWRDHVYLRKADGSALDLPVGTEQLEFYLLSPSELEFATAVKSPALASPDLIENDLQTSASGSGQFIPEGWAAGSPQTLEARVVLRDAPGGSVLAGGNTVQLNLPVEPTLDDVNVAIVLDRSGSMNSANRWPGAISGAHFFANVLATLNGGGTNHRAAVLWFSGLGPLADLNYPDAAVAGPPRYGVLGDGTNSLDFGDFDADPTTFLATLSAAETAMPPGGNTSIGAGLLFARDKLHTADPGGTAAQRVALVLSDGRENRPPSLAAPAPLVFGDDLWTDPGEAFPGGAPNVRIYAGALGTTEDWADVLRGAADATGGIGELDVKSMPDASMAALTIGNWFATNLANLFGYTPVSAPPDPSLTPGEVHSYEAEVTHGHSRLIFTLFMAEAPADPEDWQIQIQAPGELSSIDQSQMNALPGITRLDGPMYRTVIVDLPLAIPGHEHRWAGTWSFHIMSNADGPRDYLASILADGDTALKVVVDAGARPTTGQLVTIRAYVGELDQPLTQLRAEALVRPPDPWVGELYGELVGDAGALQDSGPGSGPAPVEGEDRPTKLERAGSFLLDAFEALEPPEPILVELQAIDAHTLEGSFLADRPGVWGIDTTVEGRWSPRDIDAARKQRDALRAKIFATRVGDDRVRALEALDAAGLGQQRFRLEDRQSLSVRFRVDPDLSERGGFVLGADRIRLQVTPKNDEGERLGPGWAGHVRFGYGPSGETSLRAIDGGDGSYWVDLRVGGKGVQICDSKVRGKALSLEAAGWERRIFAPQIELREFGVSALGVWMPIRVKGRLCPREPDAPVEDPRPCVPELLRECFCELLMERPRNLAILRRLLAVLAKALAQPWPARPSTHAHWAYAVKASLVSTHNAMAEVCEDPVREALEPFALALAELHRWLGEVPAAQFGSRKGDARELHALVEAVARLQKRCRALEGKLGANETS